MISATGRLGTGVAVGLLAGGISVMTAAPAQPGFRPGDPPHAFTYLRSGDGGNRFTPFQLAETPEAGITHVEASGATVHALHDDLDPQPRRIFYRRSADAGRSWDRSVRLDRPAAGSVEHGDSGESDITAEGDTVHVVWEDDRFLTADFVLPADVRLEDDVVLSDGTVLDSETPPGPDNDDDADNTVVPAGTIFPAGSVDPRVDGRFGSDGDAVTLGTDVEESIENRDDVLYTRSDDDGLTFPVPRNVSDSPDVHNVDPDVASHRDLVVVAYEGEDVVGDTTDANDVLVSVSDDGGRSFEVQRNLNLTDAPGDQDEPAVAIGGSGVHVAFRDAVPDPADPDDELARPVGYVRSTDRGRHFSGAVGLPVRGPAADFTAVSTPGILVQRDVVHILACHEDDPDSLSDGNDLLYWRSDNGGKKFDPAVVIDRSDEPCNKPVVAGAGDDLWVAYERDVHSQSDVFLLRSRDGGRRWGEARNLSDDHEGSTDPSVSAGPDGTDDVHVSWTDSSDFLFALGDGQTLPVEDGDDRRFANEDVIRFTGGAYRMVLDGSDVGLENLRIDALATLPPADREDVLRFVLSFTEPGPVPGVGTVDDSDLVLFTPTRLGERTAGTFRLWFDGSDVGLGHPSEDVDAVEVDGTTLYLSTSGPFRVRGGLSGHGEDVVACTGFRTGATSDCRDLSGAFDGSAAGLGGDNEDVDAFSFTGEGHVPEGAAFFSAPGRFEVPAASGGKADVFSCAFPEDAPADGPLTGCGDRDSPFRVVFSDDRHLLHEDIVALELQY